MINVFALFIRYGERSFVSLLSSEYVIVLKRWQAATTSSSGNDLIRSINSVLFFCIFVFDLEIPLQLSGVSASIILVLPDVILELQLSGVSASIILVLSDVILELQLSGVSASIISVLSDDSVTPTALLAFSGTVLMS